MKDIVYPPEKAAVEHVWQYESEVLEDESEVTIKVADGTAGRRPGRQALRRAQAGRKPA